MTVPVDRNRVGEEASPYSQLFASQQVNWQPWDERTLAGARERGRPLFVVVGYFCCHWCHESARDQFSDDAVVTLLNEQFVPVVVDCQERPDLDLIFQTLSQQVNDFSGWPLAVWLTPSGKPFRVEKVIPAESDREKRGLHASLEEINQTWNDSDGRREHQQRATAWTEALRETLEAVPEPSPPEENTLVATAKAAVRRADRDHGGWGTNSKFPHASRVRLLLRASERTDRKVYREVAMEALDAMANGGLYDQLGGGFHRITTDRTWTVPHFEKLLSINAELARLYLSAFEQTGNDRYETVAAETLSFIARELSHEKGGFISGLSARSENTAGQESEGSFYVWTPEQVYKAVCEDDGGVFSRSAVDERDAELFCERYGVTDSGNFEGATVLSRENSTTRIASQHDINNAQLKAALENAHDHVAATREERPRPSRDEQVLAGWNGLALSAFGRAAMVLDEKYGEPAEEAVSFLREQLWDDTTNTLTRRYCNGKAEVHGFLSDYAFLGRGAFDCYQATGKTVHLEFALELAHAIERKFWDDQRQTLYFTPQTAKRGFVRPQERTDTLTQSSMAAAVELLDTLSLFTADDSFAEIATTVVETHEGELRTNLLRSASLVLTADTVTQHETRDRTLVCEDPLSTRERPETSQVPKIHVWFPRDEAERDEWTKNLGLKRPPQVWTSSEENGTSSRCE